MSSINKEIDKGIKTVKKHKWQIIIAIAIIALILIVFGTRLVLYVNYLLGNDLLITLNADIENLQITKGVSETIEFETKVRTNPFCKAECSFKFLDISDNKILDSNTFVVRQTSPYTNEYEILINKPGAGQHLYQYKTSCQVSKSFLCATESKNITRTILVTAQYDLSQQEQLDKSYVENINLNNYEEASVLLSISHPQIDMEKPILNTTNYEVLLGEIENNYLESNFAIAREKSEQLISNIEQDYEAAQKYNNELQNSINILNDLQDQLVANIEIINSFNGKSVLDYKQDFQVLIKQYQLAIDKFENKTSLNEKTIPGIQLITEINDQRERFLVRENQTNFEHCPNCSIGESVEEVCQIRNLILLNNMSILNSTPKVCNITYQRVGLNYEAKNISYANISSLQINLGNNPQCCYYGECADCCDCPDEHYPIIFLHGHAFNARTEADYSLDTFNDLQNGLEIFGVINAGSVSLYTIDNIGQLGLMNHPVSLKTSYYFDVFADPHGQSIVQTKTESIDSYSLRLKEIVDLVKERTGKSKVNIVAHSMGGLVVRRNIQIFGSEDIHKFVMIGTPNYGVRNSVASLCGIVGEKLECQDMQHDSLFLNKLNRNIVLPETLNIVGSGCEMNKEDGDGIVLLRDSKLLNMNNVLQLQINGTCTSTTTLHTNMLDLKAHPETLDIVADFLLK